MFFESRKQANKIENKQRIISCQLREETEKKTKQWLRYKINK